MRGGVLDEGEGGSTSIHACGDARVIGLPARGVLAAISCGNFGIVSCRPQTLSRLSALPSPSLLPKVSSQSHADEMQDRRPLSLSLPLER